MFDSNAHVLSLYLSYYSSYEQNFCQPSAIHCFLTIIQHLVPFTYYMSYFYIFFISLLGILWYDNNVKIAVKSTVREETSDEKQKRHHTIS